MINEYHENEKFGIGEYISILKRYKFIIITVALIVAVLASFFSFIEKPQYVAKTVVMIERSAQSTNFLAVTDPIGMLALMNNQIEIIKSKSLLRKVNIALKNDTLLTNRGYEDVYVNGGNLSVSTIQDTYIIEISYKSEDPFLTSYIVNKIAETYYESSLEQTKSKAAQIKNFLDEQLSKVEIELNSAEILLRDFKKEEKISALTEETRILVEQLTKFEATYNEVVLDIKTEQRKKEYAYSQLSETQKRIAENISNFRSEVMQGILEEITRTEAMKSNYISQGYADDHPKIAELNRKIENLQSQLRTESSKLMDDQLAAVDPVSYSNELISTIVEANTSVSYLEARKKGLEDVLKDYNARLSQLPDKTIKLARLERNAKVSEEIYLMLKRKYEEAKLQEVAEVGDVRIIDEASQPRNPVSPKKTRNIMLGVIAGILLGLTTAFLLNFIDESVKTNEEIEAYTGEPIIGIIPYIGNGKKSKKALSDDEIAEKIRSRLITHMDPHAPIAEAYRSIRTQLKYRNLDMEKIVYVITSAMPGEGKSTTTSNLAITVANLDKKVLVIDADLRRPFTHKIFNLDNKIGLAHYLTGEADPKDIIRRTSIDYLDIITYGKKPINPSELLEKESLKRLFEYLKGKYDMIFIDAPPINLVTDPIILAGYADKILQVVFPGKSTRKELRHARKMLIPVKHKIEGIVVNNAKREKIGRAHV